MLRKLQNFLPKHSLLTILKAFIRPHLGYCDVVCDKTFNESLYKKLESAQCNGALATTRTIPGANIVKFYPELRFESLQKQT